MKSLAHPVLATLTAAALTTLLGCGGGITGTDGVDASTGSDTPQTSGDTGTEADPMLSGMMLYSTPLSTGSNFTCNTCHALQEPSEDGMRHVGHAIGDATQRPSYKNGNVTDMLAAVNSCREEWMNTDAWAADDPHWLALRDWLDTYAPDMEAPTVTISVATVPDDLTGGAFDEGEAVFHETCVMCHGDDATGTVRGPPLAGTGLTADYIALRVRTSGPSASPVYDDLTGGIMPFWSADRLSDDELLDIIAYVTTVEAAPVDPEPEPEPDPEPEPSECEATHPRVGMTATLSTLFHGVSGVATIVDDCTIMLEQFHFDGNGIEVRVYAGQGGDYTSGFSVSE
ncbi:MAG: DM13 domain-containing protein, partial [Myxococcota bacterium]|nr:DM13 domain-containing protein [Myxococcota bacterium]